MNANSCPSAGTELSFDNENTHSRRGHTDSLADPPDDEMATLPPFLVFRSPGVDFAFMAIRQPPSPTSKKQALTWQNLCDGGIQTGYYPRANSTVKSIRVGFDVSPLLSMRT